MSADGTAPVNASLAKKKWIDRDAPASPRGFFPGSSGRFRYSRVPTSDSRRRRGTGSAGHSSLGSFRRHRSCPPEPLFLRDLLVELDKDFRRRINETMKLPNIFANEIAPVSYSAGSTIFQEGQSRDCMYVVLEGEVELKVGGQVVETVGVDEFFGEMALIDCGARSATAVAKTDCSFVPINEKRFLYMVEETPFFAITVMRVLSRRLRRGNALIQQTA